MEITALSSFDLVDIVQWRHEENMVRSNWQYHRPINQKGIPQ
jgi:hypothetical protein